MAAKLLHSLTDDNPDLRKQIGCMTGFFQIFDRHHVLTSRRISQRRLVSGNSRFSNGSLVMESNNLYNQQTMEKRSNKSVNEKRRVSSEPSNLSFSSSCSSSSSLDYSRLSQPEPSSFDHITFPESPLRDSALSRPSSCSQLGRQSLDLRDVVKDSMYREARGLAVKTTSRDEATSRVLKRQDSPRPLHLAKSSDVSYRARNVPDSQRVRSKLLEAPSYYNDVKELPRSSYEMKGGHSASFHKDAHRFSCDGREINRCSFESRDAKTNQRLKEQPRLSLDSRENSGHGFNLETKSNTLSRNPQRSGGNCNDNALDQKTTGTPKRPPSVVAKLMGLEALPNSPLARDHPMGLTKRTEPDDSAAFTTLSRTNDSIQLCNSPRNLWKDPTSPRSRQPDSVMKPIPNARFPIEPAPWKQIDGNRGSPKPPFKHVKTAVSTTNSFPSVYSEIEKRLKDLEFQKSGKDLRALKQILEAMHAKLLPENSEEMQHPKVESQRGHMSPQRNLKLTNQQKQQNGRIIASTIREAHSSRTSESPIVIMKPAKLISKSGIPASSMIRVDDLPGFRNIQNGEAADRRKGYTTNQMRKDQNPKISCREAVVSSTDKKLNAKNTRSMQSPPRAQKLPKENARASNKNSGSVSPRLQLKKLELEKRSRPPNPPDLNKVRKSSNRQLVESGSPGGKIRSRSPRLPQSDDQSSEISCESRNWSNQGDDSSVQSDSNFVLDSTTDIEVIEAEKSRYDDVIENQSPSRRTLICSVSSSVHKPLDPRFSDNGSALELATLALEHPSPVSVLDVSVDRDSTPSPVRQIVHPFKDDASLKDEDSYSEVQWKPEESFPLNVGSSHNLEMSRKKLQNVDTLVQKLRRLNSSHDEASTDYIASLCENTNPDHRYISKILLASGLLLRDLGAGMAAFQFHSPDGPINPELFSVLEQTKASSPIPNKVPQPKLNQEKFHRKLIFDTVNEILVGKLASQRPASEPWSKPDKLARKNLNAQKLLRELCSEMEQLQPKKSPCSLEDGKDVLKSILHEDVMQRQSESWAEFHGEIPSIVLDVERSIFRDLVDEILTGAAAKKKKHCRQLFPK